MAAAGSASLAAGTSDTAHSSSRTLALHPADANSNRSAVDATVETIVANGGQALGYVVDVTDKSSIAKMVEGVMGAWGRIDTLVNNAGIVQDAQFRKMTDEQFERVIDVNLKGVYNVTKAVVDIMLEQNSGCILNASSIVGLYGNFGQTNYSAAKLGMVGFMNTLRLEGAKHNVYTNSLAPAALTRMTENLLPGEVAQGLAPELVTPGALFMVSDQAPNGVIIQAQGGSFGVAAILQNDKVSLGDHPTVEDVAANWERISDLSKVGTRTEKLVSQPPKK